MAVVFITHENVEREGYIEEWMVLDLSGRASVQDFLGVGGEVDEMRWWYGGGIQRVVVFWGLMYKGDRERW